MKVEEIMTADPVTIDYNATAADAVNIVGNNKVHELVVMRDKKPVGMLSPRALIERSVKSDEKVSRLMFVSPFLRPEDDVQQAIEIFIACGCRDIPVIQKENLVGIISEMDVVGTVKNGRSSKDIMRPIKYLARLGDSASDARNQIIKHNVNRLPVVDKSGKLKGIVSTVDLLNIISPAKGQRRGAREGEKANEINIENLMESRVFTVKPEDNIQKSVDLIKENRISSLIVVEDDKPVGIITPKCILSLMTSIKTSSTDLVITGLSDTYLDKRYIVENVARRQMGKIDKLSNLISLNLDFKEHKKQEDQEKAKYEIKARAKTSLGNFFTTSVDWSIEKAVKEIMDNLEKEIKKNLGRKTNRS